MVREVKEVREVKAFREIREREEKYLPGGVFCYNYCSGQRGLLPKSRDEAHKHTKTRTNGLCDDVRDVCDVRGVDAQTCVCAGNSDNDDCPF